MSCEMCKDQTKISAAYIGKCQGCGARTYLHPGESRGKKEWYEHITGQWEEDKDAVRQSLSEVTCTIAPTELAYEGLGTIWALRSESGGIYIQRSHDSEMTTRQMRDQARFYKSSGRAFNAVRAWHSESVYHGLMESLEVPRL